MSLEKLRMLLVDARNDIVNYLSYKGYPRSDYLRYKPVIESKFVTLLDLTRKLVPDTAMFLEMLMLKVKHNSLTFQDSLDALNHIFTLVEYESKIIMQLNKGNIFAGVNEKIEEATLYFKKEDYKGTINNLNTALELLLKEKFNIPSTLKGINTAKIIAIAIRYKKGHIKHMEEAKKNVSEIDNKSKHLGYVPTKVDCINALKIMEELNKNLKEVKIELTEEILDKIYSNVEVAKTM